jgi:hypothetical protein
VVKKKGLPSARDQVGAEDVTEASQGKVCQQLELMEVEKVTESFQEKRCDISSK